MNSFADYNLEQARGYHSWYESGEGKATGGEQREVMGIGLGDARGRSLLDIGCGTGFFTAWFGEIGFRAVGIDSSESMLQFARQKYGNGIEFMLADAGKLPFDDRSFDVAVFATSLEFMADAGAAIREAKRVAASEILLLMLNPDHPINVARKKKAESDGGVFRGARFPRPEELERLFNDYERWSGTFVVEPEHSSYYVLKMGDKAAEEGADKSNQPARTKQPAEKGNGVMRYALPIAEGKLCMHFGHCEQFALVDVENGKITNSESVVPPAHEPGVLPRWLSEQKVNVVIAGGMGSRAQDFFRQYGMEVVVGAQPGDPRDVVENYLAGTLESGANICDH